MTPEELALIEKLADCTIAFHQLDSYHPSDEVEFGYAIHVCQNIVMSRVAVRKYPELFRRMNK